MYTYRCVFRCTWACLYVCVCIYGCVCVCVFTHVCECVFVIFVLTFIVLPALSSVHWSRQLCTLLGTLGTSRNEEIKRDTDANKKGVRFFCLLFREALGTNVNQEINCADENNKGFRFFCLAVAYKTRIQVKFWSYSRVAYRYHTFPFYCKLCLFRTAAILRWTWRCFINYVHTF